MRIKNWKKFQHFKDRRPPWIKLHRELLDQRDINEISDSAFRLLIVLWLLAAEDEDKNGNLPIVKDISFRLRMEEVKITTLIQELGEWIDYSDINVISEPIQLVPPETETETEIKIKTLSPQNKFDDEDMRFAQWMFSLIEALPGSHKKPNFKKWANTIRLMRERDELSLKAIGTVFKWANDDDFWSSNILSPDKLRSKFSQLSAKALKPTTGNGEDRGRMKTFEEQKIDTTARAIADFVNGGDDGLQDGQRIIRDIDR